MADSSGSRGGGLGPVPPPSFSDFCFSFSYKNDICDQEISIYEYETCLKMLEMAILEIL